MGKAKRETDPLPSPDLSRYLEPLQALQALVERFDNQGVIIGGIAASLLGTPRFTADLDAVFLISVDKIAGLLTEAKSVGFEPRILDAEDFARKNRVLLLRHTLSGTNIDISLGMLPFEWEMVERSQEKYYGRVKLRIPTPEDLIILKAVAHRPKDMLDIQAVITNTPKLDRQRIEVWVKQFADALENPEIWQDLQKLLRK
jgi:hypothetical protein